ncbi:pyridoxamine 5'-phosphate oxidase family protein [Rothia sp. P13129]|uniref:pyridoxamine 5'-phosphate oxidase family protein n=1 Tax=Rothia sp. P13129 TaxID=3402664 RepID=UPI003AD2E7CB
MAEQTNPPQLLTTLEEEMCWKLINSHNIGRLSLQVGHRIDIFTVKYVVERGHIFFQARAEETFSSIVVSRQVAFEVGEVHQDIVKSVIIHGTAQWYPYDIDLTAEHKAQSSLADPRIMNWVEVIPEEISGRQMSIVPLDAMNR